MKKLITVNDTLWSHITSGRGTASFIRDLISFWPNQSFIEDLGAFFEPDDWYEKNESARNSVEQILRTKGLDYLISLWEMLNILEEQRKMSYEKHTDHSHHSLYLFLLGIWFFDNSSKFRKVYEQYNIHPNHESEINSHFLLQWIFSSLLHDIGYIFEDINLNINNKKISRHLDLLFAYNGLKRRFPYVRVETLRKIWGNASPALSKWKKEGKFPNYTKVSSNEELLEQLNKAPWLSDLNKRWPDTISKAFDINKPTGKMKKKLFNPSGDFLFAYAKSVATNGYNDSGKGEIDHAIGSGFLLFQLSSFKYWLALKCGKQFKKELGGEGDKKRFPYFAYRLESLFEYILPACHAAASHNILENVKISKKVLPIRLSNSPLLFLSILCDEIQKWHRSVVGKSYTGKRRKYIRPLAKQIYFEINSSFEWDKIYIDCKNKKAYKTIYENLGRLNYEDIRLILGFKGYGGELDVERRIREIQKRSVSA